MYAPPDSLVQSRDNWIYGWRHSEICVSFHDRDIVTSRQLLPVWIHRDIMTSRGLTQIYVRRGPYTALSTLPPNLKPSAIINIHNYLKLQGSIKQDTEVTCSTINNCKQSSGRFVSGELTDIYPLRWSSINSCLWRHSFDDIIRPQAGFPRPRIL